MPFGRCQHNTYKNVFVPAHLYHTAIRMKFLAVLLSAATAALATQVTPTVSSYNRSGCSSTPLATWSGTPEDTLCRATPGAVSLNITVGTETNCHMSVFSTCEYIHIPVVTGIPIDIDSPKPTATASTATSQ
jgi:hypothetical protein